MEAKQNSSVGVSATTETHPKHKSHHVLPYMQNRELSWLEFNKRVLDQGEDHNVPLLERLTFVSIFCSNLQEFFMVRVGSLTDLSLVNKDLRDNKTQMTPNEQLQAIYERCHELYPEEERIYNKIMGQLAECGIRQLQPEDLSPEQAEYLRKHLKERVVPYLSPQIINSRHPFPHLENGALYVLARLVSDEEGGAKSKATESKGKKKGKNIGADDATFGLIPLPHQAKRVIKLPGEGTQYILLEHAIKTIVDEVFSMYTTKRASVICVTRNADIDPNDGTEEDLDYDYREHMKRMLKKRARLAPVRLETDTPLSSATEKFLLKRLDLKPCQRYVTSVPLDMGYAWGLSSMIDSELARDITNEPFTPQWPACFDKKRPIMEQVAERDALLAYPYESMDPFISLLREAANDPSVFSIKITLYRLASQSHLAEALVTAAENGKEVTALFELRARFDESNNIEWSQRFEQAGANVIYGFHDFKVHSKICTIARHTENGIQYITQLGTGNYNEKTSRLYTDFSFITTDEGIGKDAAKFFRNMSLENASDEYQKLSVAPLQIKPMILHKIDEQIALAKSGKPNGLSFKTNSITDKDIIDKIAEASQAGVKTTLFVRGISCLVPGVEGYTENVEVVSIVGRLLEHSRIYGFGPRDNREIYLSSADLMTRNMEKRVEIAWPIYDPELKERVNKYLDISLSDTAKLRMLKNDLEYTPLEFFCSENADGSTESFDSQAYLIQKARDDYRHASELREEEEARRAELARIERMKAAEEEERKAREEAKAKEAAEEACRKAAEEAAELKAKAEAEAKAKAEAEAELAALKKAQEEAEAAALKAKAEAEAKARAEAEAELAALKKAQQEAEAQRIAAEKAAEQAEINIPRGLEEIEPGVAGPATNTAEVNAQKVDARPIVLSPSLERKVEEAADKAAIQLVPKKPSLWQRIKFLFTGRLD